MICDQMLVSGNRSICLQDVVVLFDTDHWILTRRSRCLCVLSYAFSLVFSLFVR